MSALAERLCARGSLRDTEITDAERRELLGWRRRRLVTLAGAVWVVTRTGLVELKAPAVAGKESGR